MPLVIATPELVLERRRFQHDCRALRHLCLQGEFRDCAGAVQGPCRGRPGAVRLSGDCPRTARERWPGDYGPGTMGRGLWPADYGPRRQRVARTLSRYLEDTLNENVHARSPCARPVRSRAGAMPGEPLL